MSLEPTMMAYQKSADAVMTELGAQAEQGLSQSEAQARLATHGRNKLRSKKPVPEWRKFLAQFEDVLVLLLIVAAAISAGMWLWERDSALPYESIAIFAIVLLNATIGYIQGSRAASAVAALRRMAAPRANVIRDGKRQSVPGAEVVPGDTMLIEAGDTISADARLIHCTALQTAESALTGESQPVTKDLVTISVEAAIGDRLNMIFTGTAATYGRGTAIVTTTGMNTEMGNIAGMLEAAPEEHTPLQKELDLLGKRLAIIVIVIAVLMIGTIIWVEQVRGFSALFQVLILGVALAVAAVPEGLPAMVTAVLAFGVQRMAKRHAIVRHLSAVETLGSATVIASDKTGTLTKNEMTVRAVITASGRIDFTGTGYAAEGGVTVNGGAPLEGDIRIELDRALTVGDRANNAAVQETEGRWTVQGDPTEGALITAARKVGLTAHELKSRFERVGEIPFSSERKLMSTIHTDSEQKERLLVFTKGAPGALLALCSSELVGNEKRPLSAERRAALLKTNEGLAGEALRTLAVAGRELPADAMQSVPMDHTVEQELLFIGLIGMIDPPRDEARSAVERARSAGIRPLMITGDHPKTASVIAMELGISQDGRAITGAELERLSDEQLAQTVREVSVFARVHPEHKLRIVKALQHAGEIVAMTGDGVNDAPALKTANIGVAMGITGTDVSKEAADIVLTDDNYATIVAAVEEGRAIFANIRKFLRYLLSSNFGEVLTMFLGVIFAKAIGLHAVDGTVVLPLLATQILWINLVTDGAPALALGVDPAEPGLMSLPPRPRNEGVITPRMWSGIVFIGIIMAVGTLFVLDAGLPGGFIEGSGTLPYAQTMAFSTLVLFQLFNVLNARSDDKSAACGLFQNHWLWAAITLSVLLQAAVMYMPFLQQAFSTVPLSGTDWMFCTAVASSVLWLRELTKFFRRQLGQTRRS